MLRGSQLYSVTSCGLVGLAVSTVQPNIELCHEASVPIDDRWSQSYCFAPAAGHGSLFGSARAKAIHLLQHARAAKHSRDRKRRTEASLKGIGTMSLQMWTSNTSILRIVQCGSHR